MPNEDRATRYHRLQRRAAVASTCLGALVLALAVPTGASAALRAAVASATGGSFVLTIAGYVVAVTLFLELVQLPLTFYQGVVLERRYGLSTQPTSRWWRDHLKATLLGLAFAVGIALIVWSLIRWDPRAWWAFAAGSFVFLLVLLAWVTPVLLLPIFYDFQPVDRPALAARLMSLAGRAGTRVTGVYEWRLSDRTRKANAALAGIGRTRRILLSDTLLSEHSDDEIEVILAHELAHQVHHDIWRDIAVQTGLITLGFYAADAVLGRMSGSFGLTGKADIAGLPLLVLAAGAVSLALVPVANAVSRAHERRADRYALDLTRNAEAFKTAMKRLAAQNLAEERPSRLVEVLFHTHPTTSARIAAADAWARAR